MRDKQHTYKFCQDPGHGWLAVPMVHVISLGILPQISGCSYQSNDGGTAYLEEDCDAPRFLAAYKTRYGWDPIIKTSSWGRNQSRIRSLRSIRNWADSVNAFYGEAKL